MKKKFIFFIAIVMLAGCTSAPEQTENANITEIKTEETKTEPTSESQSETASNTKEKRMTAEEMCEAVLGAIQSEDREQLKALFCDEISATHDLDDELLNFFDFVDGKFIAFTDYHTELRHGGESNKGAYVKFFIAPRIRVAKTDTEKKYTVEFYANLIYKDEPNRIGLEYIVITDSEGNELWVGDYIDN